MKSLGTSKGMIVAPQPEAAEAGAEILARGGNAVDAAVACALVQGVVDPQMCGIGGFGMMQVAFPTKGIHECLDFHARCPQLASAEMWADLIVRETLDGFGWELKGRINEIGHASVAIPGSLKAWEEAASQWGTMDWRDLLAPAIAHAGRGFKVKPFQYARWVMDETALGRASYEQKMRLTAEGQAVYFHPGGAIRQVGELVRNDGMATTLKRIAKEGADLFYKGEIAEEIDFDMRLNGGLLRREDLVAYRTQRQAPIWLRYRDVDLAGCQPPAGALVAFEILSILREFDIGALQHNGADHIGILAEAQRAALRDKDRYLRDPVFSNIPVETLLSQSYASKIAEGIRGGKVTRTKRFVAEAPDTTTVHVIDREGNVVSMTHTLGAASGVITPGLGFMFNNGMSVFDPRPGNASSIEPGKARASSMAPCIAVRNGEPFLSIGAPGGAHIPLSLAQVLSNVIDFRMQMQEAICAPRISVPGSDIELCNRIPDGVSQQLVKAGLPVKHVSQAYPFAAVHGVMRDCGQLRGGVDPQRDGVALSA